VADPSRKRRGLKLSLEFVSVTHLTSCVLELWSSDEYHRQKSRGRFLYCIWSKERRHPAEVGWTTWLVLGLHFWRSSNDWSLSTNFDVTFLQ
jgi:hypothetical protein